MCAPSSWRRRSWRWPISGAVKFCLVLKTTGAITGIQRVDLERWVMDTVFGRTVHPMILPFYEEIQVDDQHRVAVVSITQGTAKPYVVRHRGREDI